MDDRMLHPGFDPNDPKEPVINYEKIHEQAGQEIEKFLYAKIRSLGGIIFENEVKVYPSTDSLTVSISKFELRFATWLQRFEDPFKHHSYLNAPAVINCDVPERYQRNGIATEMYKIFERSLVEGGYEGYVFANLVQDERAQLFWEKMGFRHLERETGEYERSDTFPVNMIKLVGKGN